MEDKMSLQNKQNDFFLGLSKLPIILDFITKYSYEIMEISTNPKNEKKLIQEKINSILIEFKNTDNLLSEENHLIISRSLQLLFERQLEINRLANKIRKSKGDPPDIFK